MKTMLIGALSVVGLLAFTDSVSAHGGQYIGPGDTVPPGGGSAPPRGPTGPTPPSGPITGGAKPPGAVGPTGPTGSPTTGGPPPGNGGMRGGRTGRQRIQLEDDLTRWDFWWEHNKNPFLRLKESVHTEMVQTGSFEFFLGGTRRKAENLIKPTNEQIMDRILPALKQALDETLPRDFDIISACLVAMAKIGRDHPDFGLVEVFEPRLQANNQEIRETAALALGIAGMTREANRQLELLCGLALDNDLGRKASAAREVPERTRAFALYGLGLAAHGTASIEIKRAAHEVFAAILEDHSAYRRDIRVATIHGLSLLNTGGNSQAETALLKAALDTLMGYYDRRVGPGDQLVQSHVPTAVAKLLTPSHPAAARFRARFADDLRGLDKSKRGGRDIGRSCALALGQLCRPPEAEGGADARYSDLLFEAWRRQKDQQTRYFSILALGQIGGENNRVRLLKTFDKARSLDRPWCALALGVLAHGLHEGGARDAVAEATLISQLGTIGTTLHRAYQAAKSPQQVSSLAVALGLCRHVDASPDLLARLHKAKAQEDVAGYQCIGLALMDDQNAVRPIQDVLALSTRRPRLLQQGAVALGVLGDKDAAVTLRQMLQQSDNNLAKLAAISTALGLIGDQRTIAPLRDMLMDPEVSQLSRAFAAVALGGIADKEMLPWNSKIAVNTNYRANTETLTNRASGILDIL